MNLYLNHIINETLYSFNESIQYEYNVPDDIKKQFFDFYIWSYAYQNINSADFYVLGTSSAYDLDNIIREAIEKIVIVQKELLLEAGLKSIQSELQYPVSGWSSFNFDQGQIEKNRNQVRKIIKNFDTFSSATINDFYYFKNNLSKKSNYSIKDYVMDARKVFGLGTLNELYAGPAWAKICNAWLELYNAQSINEIIKEIDDMYDMQHNTGFALNKDRRFSGNWINQALDLKFSGNLWDLQSGSSIPERIVGFISKVNNQKTKEDAYNSK